MHWLLGGEVSLFMATAIQQRKDVGDMGVQIMGLLKQLLVRTIKISTCILPARYIVFIATSANRTPTLHMTHAYFKQLPNHYRAERRGK